MDGEACFNSDIIKKEKSVEPFPELPRQQLEIVGLPLIINAEYLHSSLSLPT